MAEDRSLDPRFDPRYQRGFDPATMPVEPAVLRAPVEEVGPVPPASPVLPTAAPDPNVAVRSDFDEDELEPETTRNPFRLALLLVSIGLLVIAAALTWWTANNQNAFLSGSAQETAWNWTFQSLTQLVPPAALVAGFVGLGGWLALGALGALRAQPDPHPELDDE